MTDQNQTQEDQTNQAPAQEEQQDQTVQSQEETAAAPAAQEEETAPVAPAAPTPPVAPAAPVVETASADMSGADYIAQKYKLKEIPAPVANIIAKLENYVAEMSPGVGRSAKEIAQYQRNLFLTFMSALDVADQHNSMAMEALLYIVKKHRKDVFSTKLVFRGLESVKLTPDESKLFQALIHLFTSTCDPAGRAVALKAIDFNGITKRVIHPRHAERLMQFYRIG